MLVSLITMFASANEPEKAVWATNITAAQGRHLTEVFNMVKPTIEQLTIKKGLELGYHYSNISSLRKRGALVINGEVYAPVKRRPKKKDLKA